MQAIRSRSQEEIQTIEAKSLTAAKRIAKAQQLRRFVFVDNGERLTYVNGSSDLRGKWFLMEV